MVVECRLPSVSSSSRTSGHRCSSKTWRPTVDQLQRLVYVYNNKTTTPSKHHIDDLVADLRKDGPIAYSNIYNWFKNHRTRRRDNVSTAARIGDPPFPNCGSSAYVYEKSAGMSSTTPAAVHDSSTISNFADANQCSIDVLGAPAMLCPTNERDPCLSLRNTDSAAAAARLHTSSNPFSTTVRTSSSKSWRSVLELLLLNNSSKKRTTHC